MTPIRYVIWDSNYINNIEERDPEDRNVRILQIERGACPDDYIVEIMKVEE